MFKQAIYRVMYFIQKIKVKLFKKDKDKRRYIY